MADNSALCSPTYTVEYYDKLCKSYALRAKIIPYDHKDEFIDYITRTVIFHGGLAGPLASAASYFSVPVKTISGDESLRRQVASVYQDIEGFWAQMSAWLSIFMYNTTCLIYLPRQTISMNCPNCETEFAINKPSYQYPFKIVALDYEEDGTTRMRSNAGFAEAEKRQHPKQYGISCNCPNCNSRIEGAPSVKWTFSSPGKLLVLNPKLFHVDRNDSGKKRVVIDPEYYSGKLALDKELDWFDLDNVPWNIAVTYASRESIYIPDEKMYMLFSLREFVGIGSSGDSVAPILSSVSDTVAMDIFKMGNEGLAFSKIDPLYIVSPTNVTNPAFEGMSQGQFRDFIIQGMKAHQEGDMNRVLYSPMPVDTSAIFGDGKRFMSVNELMTYNNMILGALGFSGDALNGGSGLVADPVKFEAWNNVIREFNNRFLKLLNTIMELVSVKYYRAKYSQSKDVLPTIWMPQLSQMNQGMNLQQKMQMAQQGLIPMDELMSDLGMPDMYLWESYLKETKLRDQRFQLELNREVTRINQEEAEREQTDPSVPEGSNMYAAKEAILQQAEQMAQELAGQDTGWIKSYLSDVSQEDFVLYSVVVKKLEELRGIQRREVEAQMQQQ